MKKRIVIIGAGGHGRVCADIAELMGYDSIVFLDDNKKAAGNVVSAANDFTSYINGFDIFVAIGDNAVRNRFLSDIKNAGGKTVNLIHPNSTLSKSVKLGSGIAVMAGVVVNSEAVIKDGVILNTMSSVDHNCTVGECSHISVGANIAGTVEIGKNVFVGAGATIINNVSVADGTIIGAGATVITDIKELGTYVGTPARKIK